ncbi:MAG: ABC transporter permease, partial [Thermoproteota archaeon]
GTSYLAFSLVGVATSNYLWACLTRLSHSIQHEIRGGTLETIAVTPVNMLVFFIGLTARGYLVSLIYLVGVFLVGIYGLGANLSLNPQSLSAFLIIFILMLISNQAIGLIAAGIIMVFKRGDPLVFILAALNEFLAGVLYPLQMLEKFPVIKTLSMIFPYTYALDGMRRTLIMGSSVFDANVLTDIMILIVFSMILIPVGLKVLGWGYRRIRREGTTSSY